MGAATASTPRSAASAAEEGAPASSAAATTAAASHHDPIGSGVGSAAHIGRSTAAATATTLGAGRRPTAPATLARGTSRPSGAATRTVTTHFADVDLQHISGRHREGRQYPTAASAIAPCTAAGPGHDTPIPRFTPTALRTRGIDSQRPRCRNRVRMLARCEALHTLPGNTPPRSGATPGTDHPALAAMVHVRLGVDLATIAGVPVAVRETGLARRQDTGAVLTGMRAVRHDLTGHPGAGIWWRSDTC
jgi:hypothetical protein